MSGGEYFEVRVETVFRAVHCVGIDGAPAEPHEHEWRVAARAGAANLDAIAIVVDFRRLRADLDMLTVELSGRRLEELDDFADRPASATAVGQWLLQRLRQSCGSGYRIVAVEVECDDGIRWVIGEDGAAAHAPV